MKFLRTMAIGTYLNSEVMKKLLGDEHYERFNKMLKNARKKSKLLCEQRTRRND